MVLPRETPVAPRSQGTRMRTGVGSADGCGENPKWWDSHLEAEVGQGCKGQVRATFLQKWGVQQSCHPRLLQDFICVTAGSGGCLSYVLELAERAAKGRLCSGTAGEAKAAPTSH